MNICTPEQLKAIAEALGYELDTRNCILSRFKEPSISCMLSLFDPENNAKQQKEILLWLLRDSEWDVCYSDEWCFMKLTDRGGLTISDKEYTTALLKTACVELGV